LQAVLRGCDRATHLVAQLLDLARLDAQSMGDALAPVDVMEPTRQVLAELIPQALQQGGCIDLLGPDRLLLRTDAVRVAVVLRNLVDNALRYSGASPQVQVRWQALPAMLEVQDAGPGMSQSQIQRLGDRFFRADSSREGSGLGWSIIARIAQREGLQVQVDQSPQLGGLRVRLTWPDQAHA
jgi:two-component system sensor histidine kinase QseC